MGQKQPTIKSPRWSSSLVFAREREVAKTAAINTLLIRPVAILPSRVGDPIRPFALGLWNEIRPLLKPDISVSALRKAMATYVHARSYQLAVARPGSQRHDINGEPVEPVSDADRLDALKKYESFKARNGSIFSAPASSSLAASASNRDAISAHLLRRRDAPR